MTLVYLCETHSGMSTRWEPCGPEDMGATAFVEEGSGVRVKPLEWVPAPSICTREKAAALGGHYSAVEFDAGTENAHFAANIDLGGLAFVFILEPDPLGGRRPKQFPTLDAAKAAAQADYEARILAALEPTPPAVQEQTDGGRG